MCEITNDNFEIKYQEISYNLQKANFIAIDTEFTGLHLDNEQPSLKDTAQQRYKKLKKSIELFNLIQIGLCTFRYCNEQKVFITDTYNFYVFPRNYGFNSDLINSFQTSCVEFLCKYDFDFNKLTYKGISFLNNKQEKIIQERLNKQLISSDVTRDIDEKKLQKICSDVTDWLITASIGECFEIISTKDIQEFVLHKELRNRFDCIWTHKTDGSKIIVEMISKEKRQELNNSDQSEIRKMIDMLLGFTKIFRLLVQFKKPIICHNGLMDFMYMHEKFYEPLPEAYEEFKRNINQLFPLIYDTKFISLECKKQSKNMKELYESTTLEQLFISLNREVSKKCAIYSPTIKHSPNSSKYALKSQPHEAGYDAFMCGTIFLKLAHSLCYFNSINCYNLKQNNMNDYFLVMKPFENRLKIISASLDHINFSGLDPACSKSIILFVKSKNGSLSMFELTRAFSTYGHCEVDKKSKDTAIVTVDNQTSANYILNGLKNSNVYDISLYNFWKHSFYLKPLIGSISLTAAALLVIFTFSVKK